MSACHRFLLRLLYTLHGCHRWCKVPGSMFCFRGVMQRGYDIQKPNSQNQDPIFSNYSLPDHTPGCITLGHELDNCWTCCRLSAVPMYRPSAATLFWWC